MVSVDRGDHRAAEEWFRASLAIAEHVGDQSLQAVCLVSLAELDVSLSDSRTRARTPKPRWAISAGSARVAERPTRIA